MQQTLHQHIVRLEEMIQRLSDELTKPHRPSSEIERITGEIKKAELALAHYRAAFDLERELS
jgi:hypothetical protein